MLTTFFKTIDGKQIVLWASTAYTRNVLEYRLATAVNYDDMCVYSPIEFGRV